MSAIENLKEVLFDHEGNASVRGSKEDNRIIQESIAEIEKQLALFVYDKLQRMKSKDIDDVIDEFVGVLDFDAILQWAKVLEVEVNYPPTDDMYPDWEDELAVEIGEAMRKVAKK